LELDQHGSGNAFLAVPADEISLAEARPQTREELASNRGVDARPSPGLLLQIHQEKNEWPA
jgi:hypothetical protein